MHFAKPHIILICVLFCWVLFTSVSGQVGGKKSVNSNLTDLPFGTEVTFRFSEVVSTEGDSRVRAVAFNSIVFIDSSAQSLGKFIFGTPDANDVQGEGWFENEISVPPGPFQWAGGKKRQATIQLDIPPKTRGLLIRVSAVRDSIMMEVLIKGTVADTLRVDSYWHSGFVTVGGPFEEPISGLAPQWMAGRYFPQFVSTDRLFVLPALTSIADNSSNPWDNEWRINNSYKDLMALTLVGMQGLINRNRPRVYFDWNDWFSTSGFWVPYLSENADVVKMDLDALSAVNFLLKRYNSLFKGIVIYDPLVPETINLATMLAGKDDLLILAPEQLNLPGIPDLGPVTDLRQLVQTEGWDASVESQTSIYQWVYDNIWPDLEHRIMGIISPGPPTSGQLDSRQTWPLNFAQRDYYVALKLSAIYLDPDEGSQASLLEDYFSDLSSPVPVTGGYSFSEEGLTSFISRHGCWQTALSWPGQSLSAGNVSVFSGIETNIKKYQPEMDQGRIFATLGDRPVATMFCTDGDNLQYLLDRGFHNFFVWEDVQNQRFGWTINPTLSELAPSVWNYYIDERTDVTLIAGLSGAGYMYPQLMDGGQLYNYLDFTAQYLSETGLRVVRADNRKGSWTRQLAHSYYDKLHNSGYLGIFVGYGGGSQGGISVDYYGVPAPTVKPSYEIRGQNEQAIVNDIMSRNLAEEFTDINYQINPVCVLVPDMDAVNDQTLSIPLAFSDDESCCLATKTPDITLAPGNYSAIFRLKVSNNQDTNPVANIYIGVQSDNWYGITNQLVEPADFLTSTEYQDFVLSFTLDTLTSGVQCRIDHWQGTQTDLYADYFNVIRNGGPALPSFKTVLVPLIINVNEMPYQNSAAGRFTNIFENQGGIVLTPDEYMAALNPEYMLELATPILGSGHPVILEAQQKLTGNNFLGSLITIRDGLKPRVASSLALEPLRVASIIAEEDTVEIIVNDVTSLKDLQIDMTFDSQIIQVDSVSFGPFLASTGRTVSENISVDNTNGTISIEASSSGNVPGASGMGVLTTVIFTTLNEGNTVLAFDNFQLSNIDGQNITVGRVTDSYISASLFTGIKKEKDITEKFSLSQNYPNPFNASTTIQFKIPQAEKVKLEIFNTLGQRVEVLIEKKINAGPHNITWNTEKLSSGVYFYRLTAGDFKMTRKLVLLK